MMPWCFLVWYSNYSRKTGIEWCIKSKSVKLKTSSKFFEIRLINLFEMIIPPKIVFWFFATSYYWDYYSMGWYSFWRSINFICSSVFNIFFKYSEASRYTVSSCTDLDNARFWIESKNIWDAWIYLVKTLSYTFFWCSCICLIK